jgi:hypothetical protein
VLFNHLPTKETTMKRISMIALFLLSAITMPAFKMANAAAQTFEGVVSDSMCKTKHMMPGKTAAQCIEECIKTGSDYVLVADNKVYTLTAKPGVLSHFAGKHVQVQGELKNNTIMVAAIR